MLTYSLKILIALVKFLFSKSLSRGKILYFSSSVQFSRNMRVYLTIPTDVFQPVMVGCVPSKLNNAKVLPNVFDLG